MFNHMMVEKGGEVLERVRAAFPAHPIVGKDAFAQWGGSYPDARAYAEQIDGKTWDELDRAYIVRRSDALGFLSTRELVDVLPVYLSALLDQGVWSPAAGMLTHVLAKPQKERKDAGLGPERFEALNAALTDPQRAAIAAVLRAFAATDEDGSLGQAASAALAAHWSQFLPVG